MQFGKWFNRSNTADKLKRDNPFIGIAAANTLAGLGILRQQAKLQQALGLRQLAKTLGAPPTMLEDEMLAGGDIVINPGSNHWPWVALVVFLVIVLGVGAAGAAWMLIHQAPTTASPTSLPPPTTPQRGQDYIEFFQP